MDVVLATGNPGKLREFEALLADLPFRLRPQSEFGLGSGAETGCTFVENAILKARHAARATGLPALADDSGLSVPALGGAPGVQSARYAGARASDRDNLEKLLAAMAGIEDAARAAVFVCVIVYLRTADDPSPLLATGTWHGYILREPRGTGGFGYDPVFGIAGRGCSAAELEPQDKNRISHRGQASTGLRAALAALVSGA